MTTRKAMQRWMAEWGLDFAAAVLTLLVALLLALEWARNG